MIRWFLNVEMKCFRDFGQPVNDQVSNFLVRTRNLRHLVRFLGRLCLALGIHRSKNIWGIEFALLSVPLQGPDNHSPTLGKVSSALSAILQMSITDHDFCCPLLFVVLLALSLATVSALVDWPFLDCYDRKDLPLCPCGLAGARAIRIRYLKRLSLHRQLNSYVLSLRWIPCWVPNLGKVVLETVSACIWLLSVACILIFVLPISSHLEIEAFWLVLNILHFA